MKESRLTQTFVLMMLLVAIMLTGPVSASRESRKKSTSGSSSKSSGSRQSSGTNSRRTAQPSRPAISTRSFSRPSSSSSQGTIRNSRKIIPGGTTSFNTRKTRIYTPRSSQPGLDTSTLGSSSSRVSRKLDVMPSDRSTTTPVSSRVDRKANYYDYPSTRRSLYHYNRDHYPSHRIFYWISWPDCCRPICYDWGPSFTFGYFWPYYHRKFVFVSLGGYWPCYSYRRYYWYGWHPYNWYGDCPPEYSIAGNTYNYYYYNTAPQGPALNEAHQKLEETAPPKPADETKADRYFDEAVKAFEAGDYATSTTKFNDAMQISPEDIVLPFAHVQALFAGGEYQKAGEALREALLKTSPQQEGVFYPRGLYPDENILKQQAEHLSQSVEQNPADASLRLLLGYQFLGMGKLDEAALHLENARLNSHTSQPAALLIGLLEKTRKVENGKTDSNQNQPEKPAGLQPTSSKAKVTEKAENTVSKSAANPGNENIDLGALAVAADNWLAK